MYRWDHLQVVGYLLEVLSHHGLDALGAGDFGKMWKLHLLHVEVKRRASSVFVGYFLNYAGAGAAGSSLGKSWKLHLGVFF